MRGAEHPGRFTATGVAVAVVTSLLFAAFVHVFGFYWMECGLVGDGAAVPPAAASDQGRLCRAGADFAPAGAAIIAVVYLAAAGLAWKLWRRGTWPWRKVMSMTVLILSPLLGLLTASAPADDCTETQQADRPSSCVRSSEGL